MHQQEMEGSDSCPRSSTGETSPAALRPARGPALRGTRTVWKEPGSEQENEGPGKHGGTSGPLRYCPTPEPTPRNAPGLQLHQAEPSWSGLLPPRAPTAFLSLGLAHQEPARLGFLGAAPFGHRLYLGSPRGALPPPSSPQRWPASFLTGPSWGSSAQTDGSQPSACSSPLQARVPQPCPPSAVGLGATEVSSTGDLVTGLVFPGGCTRPPTPAGAPGLQRCVDPGAGLQDGHCDQAPLAAGLAPTVPTCDLGRKAEKHGLLSPERRWLWRGVITTFRY